MNAELQQYWKIVLEVWDKGVWGVDLGRILIAVGIFLGFLAIRGLFTRFVFARIVRWTEKTSTDLDEKAVKALQGPIRFIPVTMGAFFALDYLKLPNPFAEIGDNLIRSLIAFTLFWALYALVDPLSFLMRRLEAMFTQEMVMWLVKAIKVAVAFLGGATILELWGIQVAPLLAGLGLFGVAVALGAQDLFKNLIAGILVIAEQRFRVGDWILVDGVVEGTVEDIGFRSTTVRRFDKAPVYVPNAKLSDNAVTNFTAMTHRRIYWHIGIEYGASVDQLRKVRDEIEGYILNNKDFASPSQVSTFVRIDRFSDSSIDIMLYCFTKTTNWGEWLAIKETLAYKVKEIVEGAETGFAFPSQSIYVETLPADRPEMFVPPGTPENA